MLHAILQKVKEEFPSAQLAMAPSADNGSAPYAKRAELGFLQKPNLWQYGVQWGDLAGLVPKKTREMYGVILNREVDIVLDAAGFAYSEQLGARSSVELARSCKRWKKNKTRVVLLPQAMGPFTSKKIKDAIRTVAAHADLIFARERISYDHLVSVAGERPNIRIAPDFTNLIEGELPESFDAINNRFCLVPNYRMIDMTPKKQSEAYLPFMIKCANYLLEKDLKPFILVHEGANDFMLAEKIRDAAGECIRIVKESHPVKIKGILGACDGIISSRFHGLVSALCQGIPSLGTGWSHKYRMLFEDYGFSDGLIDVTMGEEELRQKIDLITVSPKKTAIRNLILAKSNEQKTLSSEMWDNVFKVLRS